MDSQRQFGGEAGLPLVTKGKTEASLEITMEWTK
jgi:hypothetical protein